LYPLEVTIIKILVLVYFSVRIVHKQWSNMVDLITLRKACNSGAVAETFRHEEAAASRAALSQRFLKSLSLSLHMTE
jgi:hypothetical protein